MKTLSESQYILKNYVNNIKLESLPDYPSPTLQETSVYQESFADLTKEQSGFVNISPPPMPSLSSSSSFLQSSHQQNHSLEPAKLLTNNAKSQNSQFCSNDQRLSHIVNNNIQFNHEIRVENSSMMKKIKKSKQSTKN